MESLTRAPRLVSALFLMLAACSTHPLPRPSETQAAAREFLAPYHPTAVSVSSQSWDPTSARYVAVATVTLTGPEGGSQPKTWDNATFYMVRNGGRLAVDTTMTSLAGYTLYYELENQQRTLRTRPWRPDPWNTPSQPRR